MFLSRVELNPYRRETMRALESPEIMHAAVMASFNAADAGKRVLWRIDRIGSIVYLLVQSSHKPDFHHVIDQFGRPDTDQIWDVLDYSVFLSKIEDGQSWRFRLKANPVHSIADPKNPNGRGKVIAHITPDHQMKWLQDRSSKNGFEIVSEGGILLASVRHSEVTKFRRQGEKVTISVATFEGVLKVTDRESFIRMIDNGIGRAKAYGCGMMTIARL